MSKTELIFFSSVYVDKLYQSIRLSQNYEGYQMETFPFDSQPSVGKTGIYIDDDLQLFPEDTDLENSIRLYEGLSDLKPAQASDERLWTYLTHVRFFGYMKKRWPINNKEDSMSRIRERYFLRQLNLQALSRNGIARLWWYAFLTVDEIRTNKYELLEVMLQRQDLVVSITERSMGCHKNLRTGILEFFKAHPEIAGAEKHSRILIKGLNLVGGVKILPMLKVEEVISALEKINGFVLYNKLEESGEFI